jgi:uncharacterized protein
MRKCLRKKEGVKIIKGLIAAIVAIITLIALYHIFSISSSEVGEGKKEGDLRTFPKVIEERESPPREKPIPRVGIKIAIIIDDIGFNLSPVRELLKVSAPIAFAVLPHCPYSLAAAEIIHGAKREILLHLPMEPHAPDMNPGEGALFRSMKEQEIRKQVERDLGSVPYAAGVNNHMGSAFMEDEEKLYWVFQELRERGLFFIDSRTTPNSRAEVLAEKTGIKFASRKLFIDNDREEEAILKNLLGHLEKGAMASLVIIGHPYPTTVKALTEAVPIIKSRGILIVPPSEMTGIVHNGNVNTGQE